MCRVTFTHLLRNFPVNVYVSMYAVSGVDLFFLMKGKRSAEDTKACVPFPTWHHPSIHLPFDRTGASHPLYQTIERRKETFFLFIILFIKSTYHMMIYDDERLCFFFLSSSIF